jgi:hypothetical protein
LVPVFSTALAGGTVNRHFVSLMDDSGFLLPVIFSLTLWHTSAEISSLAASKSLLRTAPWSEPMRSLKKGGLLMNLWTTPDRWFPSMGSCLDAGKRESWRRYAINDEHIGVLQRTLQRDLPLDSLCSRVSLHRLVDMVMGRTERFSACTRHNDAHQCREKVMQPSVHQCNRWTHDTLQPPNGDHAPGTTCGISSPWRSLISSARSRVSWATDHWTSTQRAPSTQVVRFPWYWRRMSTGWKAEQWRRSRKGTHVRHLRDGRVRRRHAFSMVQNSLSWDQSLNGLEGTIRQPFLHQRPQCTDRTSGKSRTAASGGKGLLVIWWFLKVWKWHKDDGKKIRNPLSEA